MVVVEVVAKPVQMVVARVVPGGTAGAKDVREKNTKGTRIPGMVVQQVRIPGTQ